jgi:hypothetical protein
VVAEPDFGKQEGSVSTVRDRASIRRPFDGRSTVVSDWTDVRCLKALRALGDIELDLLTFSEASEPLRLNRGVMTEHIFTTAILSNESVALRIVEPLHSTSCHSLLIPM